MQSLTRRSLLRDGVLSVGSMMAPGILSHAARSSAAAAGNGNILVVIQMAGGNDGLQAVIPYTDPLYKQNRPTLAIPADQVIPLNAQLGLHPKLAALKPLWSAGQMAVVENVGYPNPNLSHFQSMYIWSTLDMTGQQGSASYGWLGKYISTLGSPAANPFAGFDSGTTSLATAFAAPNISVPAVSNPKGYGIASDPTDPQRSAQRSATLMQFYQEFAQTQGAQNFGDALGSTAQSAVVSAADLGKAITSYKSAATYPANNTLASSLQLVATSIIQQLDLRVGYVTIGGFDTHAGEAATHDKLYPEVAEAIAAFYADLAGHGMADRVVTMTWSEFGRRVKENGSQGTDHGTAAPLFVFGPSVKGGIVGNPPNLANLDSSGNMIFQIDFRQVYATVLDRWLGTDADTILGGHFDRLAFL